MYNNYNHLGVNITMAAKADSMDIEQDQSWERRGYIPPQTLLLDENMKNKVYKESWQQIVKGAALQGKATKEAFICIKTKWNATANIVRRHIKKGVDKIKYKRKRKRGKDTGLSVKIVEEDKEVEKEGKEIGEAIRKEFDKTTLMISKPTSDPERKERLTTLKLGDIPAQSTEPVHVIDVT